MLQVTISSLELFVLFPHWRPMSAECRLDPYLRWIVSVMAWCCVPLYIHVLLSTIIDGGNHPRSYQHNVGAGYDMGSDDHRLWHEPKKLWKEFNFRSFVFISCWKLKVLVKMTFGFWDSELVKTMRVGESTAHFDVYLFAHERVTCYQDFVRAIGSSYVLIWQFVPLGVFLSKIGEASNTAPLFIFDPNITLQGKSWFRMLDFLAHLCQVASSIMLCIRANRWAAIAWLGSSLLVTLLETMRSLGNGSARDRTPLQISGTMEEEIRRKLWIVQHLRKSRMLPVRLGSNCCGHRRVAAVLGGKNNADSVHVPIRSYRLQNQHLFPFGVPVYRDPVVSSERIGTLEWTNLGRNRVEVLAEADSTWIKLPPACFTALWSKQHIPGWCATEMAGYVILVPQDSESKTPSREEKYDNVSLKGDVDGSPESVELGAYSKPLNVIKSGIQVVGQLVRIVGANGSNAPTINGTYGATIDLYSPRPVYRKLDASKVDTTLLRYDTQRNDWRVIHPGPETANDDICFAVSLEKNIPYPTDVNLWRVWDGSKWQDQSSMTVNYQVRAFTPPSPLFSE